MATLIQTLQQVLDTMDQLLPIETKRIRLKETLQALVLEFLYNHQIYRRLNFYGGTCLHVIYELNRLSEDLDFDNSAGVDLSDLSTDLTGIFQKSWGVAGMTVGTHRGEHGILRVTLKFPVMNELRLSPYPNEALHLKIEVSHHMQIAVLQKTPVFYHGRSFVPTHFSLETMMAGKMLACLERNFQRGSQGALIKGRDYYDLLWFMQRGVQPLQEKLAKDGQKPYTVHSAVLALRDKIAGIRAPDLANDLLPMFENRLFIEAWVAGFHENFTRYSRGYLTE